MAAMMQISHSVSVRLLAPAAGLDIENSEWKDQRREQAGAHILARSQRGANERRPLPAAGTKLGPGTMVSLIGSRSPGASLLPAIARSTPLETALRSGAPRD